MAWVLDLSPDQAFEKVWEAGSIGDFDGVVDILDQASIDKNSAGGLARHGLVLEAIHELAFVEMIPVSLHRNIKKHL